MASESTDTLCDLITALSSQIPLIVIALRKDCKVY